MSAPFVSMRCVEHLHGMPFAINLAPRRLKTDLGRQGTSKPRLHVNQTREGLRKSFLISVTYNPIKELKILFLLGFQTP